MVEHYADRAEFGPSPFAAVFEAGLAELALILGGKDRLQAQRALSMVQMDGLERSLETAISEQVMDLRTHLIILATTAGVAPFVGLFGTAGRGACAAGRVRGGRWGLGFVGVRGRPPGVAESAGARGGLSVWSKTSIC